MESFDRVRGVLLEAAKAAAPPPDIGIVQWAESRRVLGHSSRLSGPYRVIRSPYWREVMHALSPCSGMQMVVVMKGAQLGASEFLLNILGYYLDLAPSPILAVQPHYRDGAPLQPTALRGDDRPVACVEGSGLSRAADECPPASYSKASVPARR